MAYPTSSRSPCHPGVAVRGPNDDPGLVVVRLDGSDRVGRCLGRTRHIRYHATVRAAKAKLTIGLSIHLIALLVDGPVMATAEQHEV
jgi:hypothetical protein